MNDLLNFKVLEVIRPAAIVDNASFTTTEIDAIGWGFATFFFHLGTTDIGITALKLQESDTSGSGFADVDGLDFNGDSDIEAATAALPGATDDGKVYVLQCDLRNRKRYLDLTATIGDGASGGYASCICVLTKPHQAPTTVSAMGAGGILRV
ncbi:MAG: hypothetical protein ACTHK7_12815 [Aureliella sp.]